MTRPKKRPQDLKASMIKIRITDELKQAFEAAAKKEAMDLSTFARVAMLEKARRAGIEI